MYPLRNQRAFSLGNHNYIRGGPLFKLVVCVSFIVDSLMRHEFCCVNLLGRSWRTVKTNQITPTYLTSGWTPRLQENYRSFKRKVYIPLRINEERTETSQRVIRFWLITPENLPWALNSAMLGEILGRYLLVEMLVFPSPTGWIVDHFRLFLGKVRVYTIDSSEMIGEFLEVFELLPVISQTQPV